MRHSATEIEVTGQSPGDGNHWRPGAALEGGESGTLARLCTAILGFCAVPGQAHRIEVSGSLRRRSSEPLLDALASAGVRIERLGGSGSWPLELWAAPADQTILLQSPVSSQ